MVTLIPKLATTKDLPALMEMAQEFASYSPYSGIEVDPASLEHILRHLIEDGVIFMVEGGFLAGALRPFLLNHNMLVAAEIAWWAPQGGGSELRKRFEEWASAMGAGLIQFSTLGNSYAKRIGDHLVSQGYAPVEVHYMKEI